MDREQFDTLARLVWTKQTRRTALGTILGAALLGHTPDLVAAKGKGKKKRKKKKDRDCYPGTSCHLGPGRNNASCDFSESVAFFEGNFSGSSFHGANFTGAQLAKADLRGADLGDACLVGANLLEADLAGANLAGAIFCRTLMPDGSINDSGCDNGTRCCPTRCRGEQCPASCENRRSEICSIIGFPAPVCCEPFVCTPTIVSPFLTGCQPPCQDDAKCQSLLGPLGACFFNPINCPYIGKCCGFSTE